MAPPARTRTPPAQGVDAGAEETLAAALRQALAGPFIRVQPVTLGDGRRVWLKRVERPGLRLRLQKGDPARALAAERRALQQLAHAGLPVPRVVAEGPDWFAIADAGPMLRLVTVAPGIAPAERRAAFVAAGRALALLHRAGFAHGRPAPRDICWDGRTARFIDLERTRPAAPGGWRQASDLAILAQSWFTAWPEDGRWFAALMEGYGAGAADGTADGMADGTADGAADGTTGATLARAGRLARLLAPLGALAGALSALRPASRELAALAPALTALRATAAAAGAPPPPAAQG